jgi:hypothetical protein
MIVSVPALLRCVHVVTGTLWAGGAILIAGYILPAARAAGPGGGAVLHQLTTVRKLPQTLLALAALTVLSGVYLVWLASGGLHAGWFASRAGLGYSAGGAAALVAFLIGAGVNIPTANRIGRLTREAQVATNVSTPAHNERLRRLAARLLWGTRAVAILVGLATAAMGIARYLV